MFRRLPPDKGYVHASNNRDNKPGDRPLSMGLPASQAVGDDLEARFHCLLGSSLAGLSMQAGLGASHSLAPAVCIVAGIRHSEAVGALLPHSIRLNERLAPGTYDDVKRAIGAGDVASRLEEMCAYGGFEPASRGSDSHLRIGSRSGRQ